MKKFHFFLQLHIIMISNTDNLIPSYYMLIKNKDFNIHNYIEIYILIYLEFLKSMISKKNSKLFIRHPKNNSPRSKSNPCWKKSFVECKKSLILNRFLYAMKCASIIKTTITNKKIIMLIFIFLKIM